jgi:hypothetical protein
MCHLWEDPIQQEIHVIYGKSVLSVKYVSFMEECTEHKIRVIYGKILLSKKYMSFMGRAY